MKGNTQKRIELKDKRAQRQAAAQQARHAREGAGHLAVQRESLAPDGSYDAPDFVVRGYYIDQPFTCVDCGKAEVWSEAQQKWWYEVAKGDIWTVAKRCRACRRRERERRTAAQRAQSAGLLRKQRGEPKPGRLPKAKRNPHDKDI